MLLISRFINKILTLLILTCIISACGNEVLNQKSNLSGLTTVHFNSESKATLSSLIYSTPLYTFSNTFHENAQSNSTGNANGGVLIYAVGQEPLDYTETLYLAHENLGGSLTIPNGNYKFYAVGFENPATNATATQGHLTGTMRCALVNSGQAIALDGRSKTIDIRLTTSDCISSQDYVPSSLRYSNAPMTVDLHSCVYGYPFTCSGGTCPNCADGDAATFRLRLMSFKKSDGSTTLKSESIQTCTQANSAGSGVSASTSIRFPFGSGLTTSPFFAELGTYSTTSTSCSETPTNIYTFQNGVATTLNTTVPSSSGTLSLGSDTTTGKAKIYARTATSVTTAKSIGNTTASTGTCATTGAQSSWCTGGTFSAGTGDGMMNGVNDIAIDSTNGFFYVADNSNHRIQKFNLSTGTFIGWIGNIATTGGSCTAGVGLFTGGWCSGGTSQSGTGDGMFDNPNATAIDTVNGFLYVADNGNYRIQKFNLNTGAFIGWIGNIATTGGTCTAGVGLFTGGWCSGGTSQSGTGDGMFNNLNDVVIDTSNGFLYAPDRNNHRIQKFNLSTGAFVGWIGSILTTGGTCTSGIGLFTGGWCSGGTSQSGTGDGMFTALRHVAIDTRSFYLYISDITNYRIQRITPP